VSTSYDPNHFQFILDGSDQIHLVYHQRLNPSGGAELRYRNITTGTTSRIDSTTGSGVTLTGLKFDIAIDPSTGRPVVAYGRYMKDPLVARLQSDGTWSKTPISHLSDRTLVYDLEYQGGKLHLLGLEGLPNSTQRKLSLSKYNAGSWTHSDIDTDVWQAWADLAVDSSGNSIAVYTKNVGSREKVFAASNQSGAWKVTKVVDVNSSFQQDVQADVEFSPSGTPHIGLFYVAPSESYSGGKYQDFARAYRQNGSWTLEMLDTGNSAGIYPEIEFDSSGKLIGFYQKGHSYAVGTFVSGAWRDSQINSDSAVYPPVAANLKLDSTGDPVIGYENQSLQGIVFYY
jgi:hypothetical protein